MVWIVRITLALGLCFASAAQASTSLDVSAWARASIAGVDNIAVYGTFTNSGDTPVAIVSVTSPVASGAMIHKTVIDQGMVSMKPMKSLPVPAGQTVVCKPGKCHIMLMGVKHPLKPGEHFEMSLGLQGGSSLDVMVKVGSIAQMTAPE